MKVGMAQINTTVGDFPGNVQRVQEALEKASERGVDLLVFPEQTLPGYPAEDLLERVDFLRDTQAAFDEVMELTRSFRPTVIIGTLFASEVEAGKPVHNSAVAIRDGRILHHEHKTLLPTYDVFDEARYFEPRGKRGVLEVGGKKIGLAICEDVWNDPSFWPQRIYATDPVEQLVGCGAEMLVVISASPFCMGREGFRYRMLQNLARRWGVALVYVNLVGGNTTLVFDGNSLALGARGELLARGAAFREDLVVVDLDCPGALVDEPRDVVAETYDALVLGTRDYMVKTGFSRAVIGLSGGIDSSLTAVIAADAIGKENVIGISMPSRYSSEGSRTDAKLLAERLGIEYHELPIEDMFTASLNTLEPLFRGRPPDVTEENLQARIRGQLLMAVSNKFGALLLTTGNKSELAVGYCTLYGDMCGGLAVISDVPKTLVYRLSRYVNRSGEVIPGTVLEKPPSAELRPDQVDQDSLPSYDVLDDILEAYIENAGDPDSIVARGHDPGLVRKILRMVDLNEYKRKQAAPGIRVTRKAFGPGRRFPIVQRYRRG